MRRTLFKLHYWLALSACIPLLLIVITGMLLVFKQPLDVLLMPQTAALPYSEDSDIPSRQKINDLMVQIDHSFPDYDIGSWELFDDGYEADRVYLIQQGTSDWFKVYLDPYSGEILSQPQTLTHYLTDWLLNLHYTLLLDGVFDQTPHLGLITGLVCDLAMTLIGITGLIIYRRFWRHFFSFNRRGKAVVVTRRLHRLIGIWSAPVLLLTGITGIYFNTVEYLEELTHHHEEQPAQAETSGRLYNTQLDFDQLLAESENAIDGFEATYILFPYEQDMGITFYGATPDRNPFASVYGSTVSFDALSGEKTQVYDIRHGGFIYRLMDSVRSIHFGDFAGNSSRVVWSASAAGMTFLIISGIFMFSYRKMKKKRRR